MLAATKCSQLKFTRCCIDSYGFGKQLPKVYKIKILSFIEWGQSEFSNWAKAENKFRGLLEVVRNTSMDRALQKIELWDNSLSLEKIKKIVKSSHIKDTQIEILDEELEIYTSFNTENLK